MVREVLAQDSGRIIRLASPLASGGDGEVFPVGQGEVAKVFKDPKRHSCAERAAAFRDRPPRDIPVAAGPAAGLRRFACPQELLLEPATDETVGYLMPRVPDAGPLIHFIDPTGPHFIKSLDDRLRLLKAILERLQILEQHPFRCVFCDLNLGNVLVHVPTLTPTIIDFDGHQITVKGRVLVTPMHRPEFLPPELHAQPARLDRARDRTHHNFAVAVTCAYFLLDGRHPFQAVPAASRLGERIREGRFPYVAGAPDAPPPGMAEHYRRRLSPHLRRLMERAFVAGHRNPSERPSVSEWLAAVEAELARPYRATLQGCMAAMQARISKPARVVPGPRAPRALRASPRGHGGRNTPRPRRPRLRRYLPHAAAILLPTLVSWALSGVISRGPWPTGAAITGDEMIAPRGGRPLDSPEIERLRMLAQFERVASQAPPSDRSDRPGGALSPTTRPEPSEVLALRAQVADQKAHPRNVVLPGTAPPDHRESFALEPAPAAPSTPETPPGHPGGFLSWLQSSADELADQLEKALGVPSKE